MSLTKSGLADPAPVTLDSLRSPQLETYVPPHLKDLPARDSVASSASFNDIALDDDDDENDDDDNSFSPVILTAKPLQPVTPTPPPPAGPDTAKLPHPLSLQPEQDERDGLLNSPAVNGSPISPFISLDPPPPGKHHKKTASTTTIRSTHRDSLESTAARRASARISLDGQQKLQEEFVRLQKEEEGHSNANGHDASIDWGAFQSLSSTDSYS